MKVVKLISKNTLRHKLRTFLTILGLAIAVMAFAVIRTSIEAWYAGTKSASPNRLITINKVSLSFSLPLAYLEKIKKIDGVVDVTYQQWFGGIYIDAKNFFAQFAVVAENNFEFYPEFIVPKDELENFITQRNAVIVGRKLADDFGWSIGDPIRLTGTIFPGDWDFVIAGIYIGADEINDERRWFMHYAYIDERMKVEAPNRAGQVGSFVIKINDPSKAAQISSNIDKMFENSLAETLTQTEEAFQLSFVEMTQSIVTGLQVISIMVIGIILLVLANTMAMTARERISEYSVLKTLGFRTKHIIGLILGESLFIACIGGILGIALSIPSVALIKTALTQFPVFVITMKTLVLAFSAAILVGFLAAIFPGFKAVNTSIVDGLRIID